MTASAPAPGPAPVVRAAGPYGLLAEVPGTAAVRALRETVHAALAADASLRALVEDVVPAARTVLVTVRQAPGAPAALARLAALLERPLTPAGPASDGGGPVVVLPCRYDGPDLEEVAGRCRLTPRQLVLRHTSTEFTVAFCGFAPGFAYLTGWPDELRVPRRNTPRTAVPTGSVGLGGEYCGVYPRSSPGGWQLIGRTTTILFDPAREPAALLAPGTRVRFTETGTEDP
jgi:KipI family sensor histidine kinase inhibitor